MQKQRQFGKYIVYEQLGRGGMGVVYRAYDTVMKRDVALKLIANTQESDLERFVNESQVMAKLDHQNIVRFYEFSYTPQPHYTMEYIAGTTLNDVIHNKRVTLDVLVDLLIKVCEALHTAHQHSIIHRDIKPANIMIDSSGQPKLMDFGLAKNSAASQKLTNSQAIIGTIHYMAPEQIDGDATTQSDLYAMGAILYEGITQRTLFQGNSNVNIMVQILENLPIPPHQLNPDISPYLEAICLKCIAKKPQKRYANARQLARELRNYRENRPIIAKKYNKWDQVRHVIHHNKILCVFVAIVLSFSLCFAIYSSIKERQLRQALQQVNIEKNNATAAQKNAESVSKELQQLNTAMIEALNHASNSSLYPGLMLDQDFIRPIKRVFEQSVRLQNAEEYNFLRGLIFSQIGDQKQQQIAIRDFGNRIAKDPQDVIAYINRGKIYYQQQDYESAMRDFNKALAMQPQFSDAYFARGRVYDAMQQYNLAVEDYTSAIRYNPKAGEAYMNRGNIYKDYFAKYNLAMADYLQYIQLHPEKEDGHINVAILYEKGQRYSEALAYYARFLRVLPYSSHGYYCRGNLYLKLKKNHKALEDYNRALQISPEKKIVYHNRGTVHHRLGNFKQALEDLNIFIDNFPNYASAYFNRGNAYRDLQQINKAFNDYNEAMRLNAKFTEVYVKRGDLYYSEKKYSSALLDYQAALRLGETSNDVQQKVARLRQLLNK